MPCGFVVEGIANTSVTIAMWLCGWGIANTSVTIAVWLCGWNDSEHKHNNCHMALWLNG